MPQIQLTDSVYLRAQRQAAAAGFDSVDDYVAEMVSQDSLDGNSDHDHLFTPERLTHLDQISAAIDAGAKGHSVDEVKAHFERKRKTWPKKDAG